MDPFAPAATRVDPPGAFEPAAGVLASGDARADLPRRPVPRPRRVRDATIDAIKRRWRELAREHHPDRAAGDSGRSRADDLAHGAHQRRVRPVARSRPPGTIRRLPAGTSGTRDRYGRGRRRRNRIASRGDRAAAFDATGRRRPGGAAAATADPTGHRALRHERRVSPAQRDDEFRRLVAAWSAARSIGGHAMRPRTTVAPARRQGRCAAATELARACPPLRRRDQHRSNSVGSTGSRWVRWPSWSRRTSTGSPARSRETGTWSPVHG